MFVKSKIMKGGQQVLLVHFIVVTISLPPLQQYLTVPLAKNHFIFLQHLIKKHFYQFDEKPAEQVMAYLVEHLSSPFYEEYLV